MLNEDIKLGLLSKRNQIEAHIQCFCEWGEENGKVSLFEIHLNARIVLPV